VSRIPLHHLFHPDNAMEYADALHAGVRHLTEQLGQVTGPVTGRSPAEAALPVTEVDLDEPLADHRAAVEEITRLWMQDAVWFHEPSYAAHLNCPVVIPALVAELFLSAVNSSMDTFDQSVGGTFMERHLIDWTAGRIGFGERADGVFTSGGSQSNLQALFCARGRAEHRGAEPGRLRILASADGHFSVQKSARLMGLGDAAVIPVATDRERRMDPVALERALAGCLARGEVPMAVVSTAGTTDFGAVDDLPAVADLCRAYDAWFHVDAAYGGGLLVSPRHAHRLAGIERADSVTIDYHKTFFQPVSSSAAVFRERATMTPVTYHADYLNPLESTNPNQVDKTLQTTRRFDALKLWMTLRVMGPDAIGGYLDTVIDLARGVHDAVAHLEDVEVAAEPQLSTLVLRYAPADADEEEIAHLNTEIRSVLFHRGSAVVAATKVDGCQFLKLTLLNPKATREDVVGIVDQIRTVGRELRAEERVALAGGERSDRHPLSMEATR